MGYSKNKNNEASQFGNNTVNIIASGTEIIGSLNSSSDIRIDGKIQGKISTQGKVVVGQSAIQEGDIHCDSIDIIGKVFGNLHAKKKALLQSTANVIGDITTSQLIIEAGATFSGSCKMGDVNKKENLSLHLIKEKEKKKTRR